MPRTPGQLDKGFRPGELNQDLPSKLDTGQFGFLFLLGGGRVRLTHGKHERVRGMNMGVFAAGVMAAQGGCDFGSPAGDLSGWRLRPVDQETLATDSAPHVVRGI